MTTQPLLTPFHSAQLALENRVVMAPMSRCRADNPGWVPTDLMTEYYRQRATAGLLITEAIYVSPQAAGYINIPGIYTPEQVAGWQHVTHGVHELGGRIFAQIWHMGRISHPDSLGGQLPLAPSAINPQAQVFTHAGMVDTVEPQEMTLNQIRQTITDFAQAAQNALAAGFDGVEVHASNGFLLHQFFNGSSNHRTDAYGGSMEKRARILFDVLDAIQQAGVDLGKVGVRLNPSLTGMNGITLDAETIPTFDYIVDRLNDYQLAYLHLSEPYTDVSQEPLAEPHVAKRYRPRYQGTLIINSGMTQEKGNQLLAAGDADLISFGAPYVANPDLVARFAQYAPLALSDKATYYTPGSKGYTDYPVLATEPAQLA